MKIICTQENLSRGLQLVSHVASKNVSLPILSNVLLKTENGRLQLMTTNLEIGIICNVRGKVEREGSFTVQAKTLSDYINLLPKENVTLDLKEQSLKIECKNAKTIMKGVEAVEFPLIPEIEAQNTYEVKTTVLKEALTSVAFAVSFDETRPEISGVYFNFKGDTLTTASTDSYRLAEKKVRLEKTASSEHSVIVPGKTVHELVRILSEASGTVIIQSSDNQILFSLGDTKLTSRVVEGQYPNYTQIIPKESRTRVTINTNEFLNTVKRASLFCKPGGNDIVLHFNPETKQVIVSATNLQIGESEAKQEAIIDGDENSIVFNYRFLLDGLQNIDSEDTIIEINTNANPGLLRPAQGEGYVYIIMPIKQ